MATLKEGQIITLKAGSTYHDGKSIPSWVFGKTLYYRGHNAKGIVFSTQKTGAITGIVKASCVNEFTTELTPEKEVIKVDETQELLKKCVSDIEKLDSFQKLLAKV